MEEINDNGINIKAQILQCQKKEMTNTLCVSFNEITFRFSSQSTYFLLLIL